eukprot:TRINITY_DN7608_c0_g4_i1.p1 TRINITY_DN7608_c0_g4~~TRINITY_DN7608_c0_g4_i1.p1  ORF type:complete len:1023 (+),score=422.67 TRINITY_DN7608_c0_g4_i1:112-3069(+)
MARFNKTKTGRDLGNSKQFFELIRAIGEAKSKQEEDKIINKEISVLKASMSAKDIDRRQMKEYVVRLLYCEMLGHNAEFGYIHCVKLIASPDLLQKRTGYLSVQLTIAPENELLYLIVAAIQKDLKSSNYLEVCAALTAATKLINAELMQCVLQDVQQCLKHISPLVRKKAIVCIHAFWRRNDIGIGDAKQYQQILCDKDPSVMAGALTFLHDLCCLAPDEHKHLVPSFVSILKQVCEHRLTREYDYHRIPAPWIQIKLLKLLSILCHQDVERSIQTYEVLGEVMKRADSGMNIGHSVIFECVKAITCLAPNQELLEAAADSIAKFLTSPNPNLKYLGITALSRIVLINPAYAVEHQHIVIDCLEDHDETIRRKTLDLLYAMTNENNVEVIVLRLIKFLATAHDVYLKADLVHNICDLAYRFYPTMEWYIDTMNRVIKLGWVHVDNQTVQGMLKMIAEGDDELEDDVNERFRLGTVQTYFQLLQTDEKLPETLVQIIAWVLGEYGYMSAENTRDDLIDKLCDLLESPHDQVETRGWIITALMKLCAQSGSCVPGHVQELVTGLRSSQCLTLQQRCYEFLELGKHHALMASVLPLDGCCEELEVNAKLSFLDGVVQQAMASGAKAYKKQSDDFAMPENIDTGLRTEKYADPTMQQVNLEEDAPPEVTEDNEPQLNIAPAAKRWGKENLEPERPDDAVIMPAAQPEETVDDDEQPDPEMAAPAHEADLQDGPRKLTEKEKFAMDLFGGGAPRKKRTKAEKEAAKAAKEAKKAAKEAKKGKGKSVSSPLTNGSDISAGAAIAEPPAPAYDHSDAHDAHTPEAAPLAAPAAFSAPAPAPAPAPAAAPAPAPAPPPAPAAGGLDLDDLFGGPPAQAKPAANPLLAQLTPLNPQQLPTQQFGGQWMTLPNELSASISQFTQSTPQTASAKLQAANIGLVQIIGTEFIAGATHPTGLVLCHFRCDPNAVTVKVRTSSQQLSQQVVQLLQSTL